LKDFAVVGCISVIRDNYSYHETATPSSHKS